MRISGSAERGACNMMYLLSFTCCTPSIRIMRRSTHSSFSGGSVSGVRMMTAWLSITVSTSRRWLAWSVEPVETRSQMRSCATESGRDLDGTGQGHDVSGDVPLAEVLLQQVRIRRRDSFAADRVGPVVGEAFRNRERQAAAAEIQGTNHLEAGGVSALPQLEAFFLENVETHQAEVAHVLLDEIGNVVVTDEQHIQRHVLAKTHQLIFAPRQLQAAAGQHVERGIGETPRLLDCQLQTQFIHGGMPLCSFVGRLLRNHRCHFAGSALRDR